MVDISMDTVYKTQESINAVLTEAIICLPPHAKVVRLEHPDAKIGAISSTIENGIAIDNFEINIYAPIINTDHDTSEVVREVLLLDMDALHGKKVSDVSAIKDAIIVQEAETVSAHLRNTVCTPPDMILLVHIVTRV